MPSRVRSVSPGHTSSCMAFTHSPWVTFAAAFFRSSAHPDHGSTAVLGDHLFPVDLYLLEVHGPNVVLGIQWLQTLGRVSHDYGNMTMFQPVTLRGDVPGPKLISFGHLCTLASTTKVVEFYEVVPAHLPDVVASEVAPSLPTDLPAIIREVLPSHHVVFGVSTCLPPARAWDHRIHLVNGAPITTHTFRRRKLSDKCGRCCSKGLSVTAKALSLPPFYFSKLMEYKFRIEYKRGSANRGADALSRREEELDTAAFQAFSVQAIPKLMDAIQKENNTLPDLQTLHASVQAGSAPAEVWDSTSMDFVTGVPPSRGFMVVVDRLSKYTHFGPLAAGYDAPKAAKFFVEIVVKHHGFPGDIISDCDPIFLSLFWKELLRLSGSSLKYSTTYHPHRDGETEVVNRSLEQYLRAFTYERPMRWAAGSPSPKCSSTRCVLEGTAHLSPCGSAGSTHRASGYFDGSDVDATWEPTVALQEQFPTLRLEDKATSVGGGVDTVQEDVDDPNINPTHTRPRRNVGPPQ
ncbi:unnamed protein product [Cuscuta campestris]|uniref:Integrase catalytic domain-containing protein n=1 Tax=Cuscuta campestris TaxID=132261 RepID=A0A484KP25_9ASTE|nr:unnamed protein product [Cuscuta campestris]